MSQPLSPTRLGPGSPVRFFWGRSGVCCVRRPQRLLALGLEAQVASAVRIQSARAIDLLLKSLQIERAWYFSHGAIPLFELSIPRLAFHASRQRNRTRARAVRALGKFPSYRRRAVARCLGSRRRIRNASCLYCCWLIWVMSLGLGSPCCIAARVAARNLILVTVNTPVIPAASMAR
jgi:hypothetical protein